MKIHIPSHLEKFEVISQLKKILVEYSKGGLTTDGTNSFEDYLYQRSLDPVKKFLLMCISKDRIGENVNYESLINYYTSVFFSFRGTLKIFDILDNIKNILGITIISHEYTVTTLTVEFGDVETSSINLFSSISTEFFKALFYYQDYMDTIETLKLDLVSDINVTITGGIVSYTEYKIEEEVLEDEN